MSTTMMRASMTFVATIAIIGTFPTALAHGHGEGEMDMHMGGDVEAKPSADGYPPTYFAHPEHASVLYAHIGLMVLSWFFMLPIGVLLSIARSRYTLAIQFLFLATNALGVILAISYNANTPDLYPNNAHHKIGWVATWVVCAQVGIHVIGRVAGVISGKSAKTHSKEEQQGFIPVSTANMEEHQRINDALYTSPYRHSNDSGQGTEPNTECLRGNAVSNSSHDSPVESPFEPQDRRMDYDDMEDLEFKTAKINPSKATSLARKIAGKISSRGWKVMLFAYNFIDRSILFLGYATIMTGIATWARFFEGHEIFSGMAHWVKGAVFFWFGVLTVGRWAGSFGELGWAWNVRPKRQSKAWRPSAEFVEGALIFIYGATNIFMEHLGSSQESYSSQDLEHMSITVLFIGGGLLAMLIESTSIRNLLNSTVAEATLAHPDQHYNDEERSVLQPPAQYEFSINPIPALVILLLGIMMSSHTQQSMISSMIHKQWGNLLTGASFARGLTYVLLYLRPPRSVLPSRPPTELLTAFGLISGGIIFMASSSDTIAGMIHYDLDAMFTYTVTMGFVALLMAWIILVLAIKGWAVRKEMGRSPRTWSRA